MFDNSGYYANRDDPISLAFQGFINRLLRSRAATCVLLFMTASLTAVGIWNGIVDLYVASNGVTESAAVIGSSQVNRKDGYTVRFAYRYGDQPDVLRVIEPWWQSQEAGVGQCTLISDPESGGARGSTVKVTYLPNSPGVYIVQGDMFTEFLRWILTGITLLFAMGCGWNLLRISNGAPAVRIPSYADLGMH